MKCSWKKKKGKKKKKKKRRCIYSLWIAHYPTRVLWHEAKATRWFSIFCLGIALKCAADSRRKRRNTHTHTEDGSSRSWYGKMTVNMHSAGSILFLSRGTRPLKSFFSKLRDNRLGIQRFARPSGRPAECGSTWQNEHILARRTHNRRPRETARQDRASFQKELGQMSLGIRGGIFFVSIVGRKISWRTSHLSRIHTAWRMYTSIHKY